MVPRKIADLLTVLVGRYNSEQPMRYLNIGLVR